MGSVKEGPENLVGSVFPPVATPPSSEVDGGTGDLSRREFLQAGALLGAAAIVPWTRDLVVFRTEAFDVAAESSAQLQRAGVRVETAPVRRLIGRGRSLEAVELSTGDRVPGGVLFAHPPQRQVDLVRSLDLTLNDHGFVQVEAMKGETSAQGVFAAGDLTTRGQAASFASSASVLAATMINFELNSELALSGAL